MTTRGKYTKINQVRSNQFRNQNDIYIRFHNTYGRYVTRALTLFLTQKQPSVRIIAVERLMERALWVAQIVRRKIQGLHMILDISQKTIINTYQPHEEGLVTVQQEKYLTILQVILTKQPTELQLNSPGYHSPLNTHIYRQKTEHNQQQQEQVQSKTPQQQPQQILTNKYYKNYTNQDKQRMYQRQKNGETLSIYGKRRLPYNFPQYLNKLQKLQNIYISGKNLQHIDFRYNKQLTEISLRFNRLFSVNLSENYKLTQLYLKGNRLQHIDLSKNINLVGLFLQHNLFPKIDVSNNINLVHLWLTDNKVEKVDLTNNKDLIRLQIESNKLKEIDLINNPKLTSLSLGGNHLTDICLSSNTKLTKLSLRWNKIKSIDLTANIKLTQLWLGGNLIESIDIRFNRKLIKLWLDYNKLSEIDISQHIYLHQLWLNGNHIQKISLINNKHLQQIWIGNNSLKTIDLTANPKLNKISLQNNRLSLIQFWTNHIHSIDQINIQNQKSEKCQVQLLHKKGMDEESKALKENLSSAVLQNKHNQHKCIYNYTLVQIA